MKLKQVSYRRLWNTGNYENETVELIAEIEPDEDAQIVLDKLRQQAAEWFQTRGHAR